MLGCPLAPDKARAGPSTLVHGCTGGELNLDSQQAGREQLPPHLQRCTGASAPAASPPTSARTAPCSHPGSQAREAGAHPSRLCPAGRDSATRSRSSRSDNTPRPAAGPELPHPCPKTSHFRSHKPTAFSQKAGKQQPCGRALLPGTGSGSAKHEGSGIPNLVLPSPMENRVGNQHQS